VRDDLDIPLPASGPNFRVPRRRPGMDPNTKRLAIIAGSIGGTLLLLVGAWSLTGHQRTGLPVVEADASPLRVKPADPGGMEVDGRDASILSGKPDGEAKLAPPPEVPALQALKQQAEAEAAARAAAAPAPVAPPAEAKAPAARVAAAEAPAARVPDVKAPAAVVARAEPVAPHLAEKVSLRAPAVPSVAQAPAVRPTARTPAPQAARAGGTLVQLAAVQSEQAAMAEWHRLERRMPDLLGGRAPTVMKVEHDGRVFYRLRTGGFASVSQAGTFCSQVKAKGGGCTIAAF